MNQDWEIRSFEDCIERVSSSNKIPKKKFLTSGQFPIISQEDEYINGYWDKPEDLFKVEKPIVIFGEHTTKLKYIDFDFVKGADGIKVLLPKKDLNTLFFYYQLQSISFEDLGYARHYRLLKKEKIVIPTLEEQKQIVAKLDEAFATIDTAKLNVEKNLENARELFQSKLNEIFSHKGEGWVENKLGDIGKPSMCKRIFKDETSKEGEIPFYKIGTFGKTPDVYISKSLYKEYRAKYRFPKLGDILISASGTIGRTVVYDGEPAYFQDSNIVWIDNDEKIVSNEYLYCFYRTVNWGESKGATISRLYNSNLEIIEICFPKSSDDQKNIVNLFNTFNDQIKSLESKYQQELDSLEELKKSILEKAFNGEL